MLDIMKLWIAAMLGHFGAVSLKTFQDIVILSFCDIVNGQAIYTYNCPFVLCTKL